MPVQSRQAFPGRVPLHDREEPPEHHRTAGDQKVLSPLQQDDSPQGDQVILQVFSSSHRS